MRAVPAAQLKAKARSRRAGEGQQGGGAADKGEAGGEELHARVKPEM
jgi:hypothetical protein